MTEKQYLAERAQIEVLESTAELQTALKARASNLKKTQADIAKAEQDLIKAKIESESEYDRLSLVVHKAELQLNASKLYAKKTAFEAEMNGDL